MRKKLSRLFCGVYMCVVWSQKRSKKIWKHSSWKKKNSFCSLKCTHAVYDVAFLINYFCIACALTVYAFKLELHIGTHIYICIHTNTLRSKRFVDEFLLVLEMYLDIWKTLGFISSFTLCTKTDRLHSQFKLSISNSFSSIVVWKFNI